MQYNELLSTFGGMYYYPSEVRSTSYDKKTGTYKMIFNSGVEYEYKAQSTSVNNKNIPVISSVREGNGTVTTNLRNTEGGNLTGSDKQDSIFLQDCYNTYVDVSQDNQKDTVEIRNINKRAANTVKRDLIDDVTAIMYSIGDLDQVIGEAKENLWDTLLSQFTGETTSIFEQTPNR